MVLFGTGRYLEQIDIADSSRQSFYAVVDGGSGITRENLVKRELTVKSRKHDGGSQQVRISEGAGFDGSEYSGWYVDLPESGERIVQSPQVRGRTVFVNSTIPGGDPCDNGGDSWMMAFGLDGKSPEWPVWSNLDNSSTGIAGHRVDGSVVHNGTLIGEHAFMQRSDGEFWRERVEPGQSPGQLGRQSWQELYE